MNHSNDIVPSQNHLDQQYNLRARHPNFQDYFDSYAALSQELRQSYTPTSDQPYGDHPLQSVDWIPASEPNAPLFVFIHGGYWKSLDKNCFHFTAKPFLEQGWAAAFVNYRLAPEATLSEIVDDVLESLRWIHNQAPTFNANPNNLYLSGHSAGGHLAVLSAMQLSGPANPLLSSIKAVLSISGIFDLDPIRRSFLNQELNLDEESVANLSPLRHPNCKTSIPHLFAVGATETEGFINQSQDMHHRMQANENPSQFISLPDFNHFDIVLEMANPNSPLIQPFLTQNNATS